jgi:hypothetical protein
MRAERQAAPIARAGSSTKPRSSPRSAPRICGDVRAGRALGLPRAKGRAAEACRFLRDGSIVIPLLRYDKPQEERCARAADLPRPGGMSARARSCRPRPSRRTSPRRLRAAPGPRRRVDHAGAGVRGLRHGLSIRMATDRQVPVYVALDAYNLGPSSRSCASCTPKAHLLICADDDWKTADHHGANPGRRAAKRPRSHRALRHRLARVQPGHARRQRTPTSTTCTCAKACRSYPSSCTP